MDESKEYSVAKEVCYVFSLGIIVGLSLLVISLLFVEFFKA